MSNEMIERVAKAVAICRIDSYGSDVDIAKAAIAAMRQPTREMISANKSIDADSEYKAMIDAALKE